MMSVSIMLQRWFPFPLSSIPLHRPGRRHTEAWRESGCSKAELQVPVWNIMATAKMEYVSCNKEAAAKLNLAWARFFFSRVTS